MYAFGEVGGGDRGLHVDQVGAWALLRDYAGDRGVVGLDASLQPQITLGCDLSDE